jgi:hypothetical protein
VCVCVCVCVSECHMCVFVCVCVGGCVRELDELDIPEHTSARQESGFFDVLDTAARGITFHNL